MRIPAREYERLPAHLQALFQHVDGSDEVLAAFAAFGENVHGAGHARPEPGGGSFKKSDIGWSVGAGKKGFRIGDDGSPARFFYSSKGNRVDRWGSRHPTVKPVELMKWLVALVTPHQGTLLDPFAGSGTTAVAAMATGRNAILIEQSAEYVADIRERVAFYEGNGRHSTASKNRNARTGASMPLFPEPELDVAE